MKCPPNDEIMIIMNKLKQRLETAIEIDGIIKEEFDYYEECMKEQVANILCKKRH